MKENGNIYKLFSRELLKKIREQFYYVDYCPYLGPRIFLESSGGSLRLKSVVKRVQEEVSLPDNTGRDNPASKHVNEVLTEGQRDVKLFLGARSGQIMSAQSSTHAIFRIINAIASSNPGTDIITTNLEHPAVYDSTKYFAIKYGGERKIAKYSPENGNVAMKTILEKIDKNTSLLAFIHSSNITGATNDAEKITKEARRINPNLYVLIDGTQYTPHSIVDIEKLKADAYVFGSYKIFGKKGVGFAYLSDRLSKLSHWKLQGKPDDFWDLGTLDNSSFASWTAVVDYICWIGRHFTDSTERRDQIIAGMNMIRSHTVALLQILLYGNKNTKGLFDLKNIITYGIDKNILNRNCLVAFNIKGMNSAKVVKYCRQKGIVVHNRTCDAYSKHTLQDLNVESLVRVSAAHYNTPEEVEKFLKIINILTHKVA